MPTDEFPPPILIFTKDQTFDLFLSPASPYQPLKALHAIHSKGTLCPGSLGRPQLNRTRDRYGQSNRLPPNKPKIQIPHRHDYHLQPSLDPTIGRVNDTEACHGTDYEFEIMKFFVGSGRRKGVVRLPHAPPVGETTDLPSTISILCT